MAVVNLFESRGKVMGKENSLFNQVVWDKDEWGYSYYDLRLKRFEPNRKMRVVPASDEERTNTYKEDTRKYFHDLNSTTGKLTELYKNERGQVPFPYKPYWDGVLTVANNDFFSIDDLVLVIQKDANSHKHVHPVLKQLSFQNIGVEFEFQTNEGGTYRHYMLLPTPENYNSYVGAEGSKDDQVRYQLGMKQEYFYYLKLNDNRYITIKLELSFVFMYHGNDFEPLGVIDASKFFPQIRYTVEELNFTDKELYPEPGGDVYLLPEEMPSLVALQLTSLPSNIDVNSCKVRGFKGRVKMTANNNSLHHVDIRPDGQGNFIDHNYLKQVREWIPAPPIPSMIEKFFNQSLVDSNVPGFYTDSNYSGKDAKSRMFPIYRIYGAMPPTWAYIFDYVKPNILREAEIQATYGIQDRSQSNAIKFQAERKVKYTYPLGTEKAITLVKKSRQGQYDNIHFHGYLGYYKDNSLPVIHAPICGLCCFHLHWRWSKLNYDLNGSIFRPLTPAKGNPTRFNGWTSDGYNLGGGWGLPLIPPNQSLKIALTNENKVPFNREFVINPAGTPASLDEKVKTIWYSVDVLNNVLDDEVSYVVLEQGAGYAFQYSEDVETAFRYAKRVIRFLTPRLAAMNDIYNFLTDNSIYNILSTSDLFEITYRMMRVYNLGTYADVEQVPNGDYQSNINQPTMEDL